ncbi:MAG: YceI family protein [Flavobacteriales bacterium]|nr:YceI family protein [Flavobacteriales bacterium]
MRKIILSATLVLSTVLGTKAHNNTEIKINNSISSVEWIGKKVTGQHNGGISIKEGTFQLHDGKLEKGKVIIDMTTITCADLTGELNQKLVGHLNSKDFFDIENNKTATLDIIKIAPGKDGFSTVSGNLTIKGITKPIEFSAKIDVKEGKLAAFAELKVDRTLYDIKYGSGKFFDSLGDKTIDDYFTIKFKIGAH